MKKLLGFLSTVWLGLSTHKLRSFLTMLGVVIGVASVITLMSIGKGAEAQILSNIESLGSNLVSISPGALTTVGGGVRVVRSFGGGAGGTLTVQDAEAIAQEVPDVVAVSPSYSTSLQLVAGTENTNARINGVNPEYFQINNLNVASGSIFSDSQYQSALNVAVLGSNVAETLFPDSDPIGQQMRMGQTITTVVGVLESKGQSFTSSDDAVYIPLTAMQRTVAQALTIKGDQAVSGITLTVANESETQTVIDNITALLRSRHNLTASAEDDFTIQSVQEIAQTLSETIGTLTILLGAIAAISLLVGGIGVMNIMLVSVLERTREIGIRKALGARDTDIWGQFLIESAFLTFAGGIIGVALGWVISYIVNRTGFTSTLVTPDIVILAVGVSVGIGLFFGFYPAWNASRLNPIEALRSE
jgi:putative ABC transport system permease protein